MEPHSPPLPRSPFLRADPTNRTIITAAFDVDGTPSMFNANEQERIISIWRAVAEDFAAFEIDITTENPGADKLVGRRAC
jgi:hypothetical protein